MTSSVDDASGRVHEVQSGYTGDMMEYFGRIIEDHRSRPRAKKD